MLLSLLPASSSTADAGVGDASDARDAVGEHLLSAVALKPFHDARDARRDAPEWQPAAVSFASRPPSPVAMPGILGMLVGMLGSRRFTILGMLAEMLQNGNRPPFRSPAASGRRLRCQGF